ncbi:MAG: hypothetical protein ACE5IT_06445 [bacterium]
MNKKEKLKELKAKLEELKKRDPSHHGGTKGFVGPSMSMELFQKIENLEEEIKKLEEQEG